MKCLGCGRETLVVKGGWYIRCDRCGTRWSGRKQDGSGRNREWRRWINGIREWSPELEGCMRVEGEIK